MARPRPPPAQPQQPAQQQVQAPAPTAAPEDEEEREPTTTIKFKETLTWRPGQRIETDTLMKRLQTLSKELAAIEQGDVDKDSLVPYAKQLASSGLLTHKEKGVKAWTACCLVDVLRLCAPDAPYTASQLKVRRLLSTSNPPGRFWEKGGGGSC